jgi:hypothetical protein
MSNTKSVSVPIFDIKDDTYVYRYGMTIKELREEIQYKIASVNIKQNQTVQMSKDPWDTDDDEAMKDDEDIVEENEQTDTEEWDITFNGNPLFRQPQDWSKWMTAGSEGVGGTGHLPTEWNDEEIKSSFYTPTWPTEAEKTKPKCEHKTTRDVELIFTTATECVDCGERLK